MVKSNKVRMEISREMHGRFKSIGAKTNDERMQRVIDVNEDYKSLLRAYGQIVVGHQKEINKLNGMLSLSILVSVISVAYIAIREGWFI